MASTSKKWKCETMHQSKSQKCSYVCFHQYSLHRFLKQTASNLQNIKRQMGLPEWIHRQGARIPFAAEIGLDLIWAFLALTGWSLAELPIQNKIALNCDWALTNNNNNNNNNNRFSTPLTGFNMHFTLQCIVLLSHCCSLRWVPK